MKIALIGYGKMGHIIEQIARSRGHEIVAIIDKDNTQDFNTDAFRSAECAIEFSTPATAVSNILASFAQGVPVVCGTTGWLAQLPEIEKGCADADSAFMFASNFSVGVNIFKAVNRYLAGIMADFPQYKPEMEEVHHIHKLDHPSGTAITLAEELADANPFVAGWTENEPDGKSMHIEGKEGMLLPIAHRREGEVPGIHTITWNSDVDYISITHSARNREGFALGAVLAAEWLATRKGVHAIDEMFNF